MSCLRIAVLFSTAALLATHGWSQERWISEVIAERHLADSALDIHRRASAMGPAERYDYLLNHVLPTSRDDLVRLTVDFTPTHPAPTKATGSNDSAPRSQPSGCGAKMVSPALDLIAVASELERLADLQARVEARSAESDQQKRAKLSLIAMLQIARNDLEAAQKTLDVLFPLIETNLDHSLHGRAPELLAIQSALSNPQTRRFASDAATLVVLRNIRIPSRGPAEPWETQLQSRLTDTRLPQDDTPASAEKATEHCGVEWNGEALVQWHATSRWTAERRGRGAAISRWSREKDVVENLSSHGDDYLFYCSPLRGHFQVECDLQTRNYENSQLILCGNWGESLYYNRNKYDFGDLRQLLGRGDVVPRLMKYRKAMHVRAEVQDRTVRYFANGRLFHTVESSDEPDPWLILRSDARHDGPIADVRIFGEPTIPEELALTANESLVGWNSYFHHTVGKSPSLWEQMGDLGKGGGIIGRSHFSQGGMHQERLLHYHRPMFEDGSIRWEFYYRENSMHVHPALDRLAFMLNPTGVQVHWVTDGPFERTDLDPGNVADEPECRRGPEMLPLISDGWNRCELSLKGDTVSIVLNEKLIYERQLEPTNQRNFGFFHFADRSQARIRNVRWRGGWPRSLPNISDQELANDVAKTLEARSRELTALFEHDFKTAIPETLMVSKSTGGTSVQAINGLYVRQVGKGGYASTALSLNAFVSGDFDVLVEYADFQSDAGEDAIGTMGLKVRTAQARPQQCLLLRRFIRAPKEEDSHVWQAVVRNGPTEADLDWKTLHSDAQDSVDGKLWLARRGKRAYFLAAEADSPNFRLLGEATVSSEPLPAQAIELFAQTSGTAHTQVIWKSLVVRAEQISQTPAFVPESTLWVMNRDGSDLRRLLPEGTPISNPGSPEFSPNGQLVGFDIYNGSTAKSRLYVVKSDGTDLRDLGIGNMPSFSPDSRRIVFSSGVDGVVIMDVDGKNREVVEARGWGAQWSPDGRIAYTQSSNIIVYDPRTRTKRFVLEGDQQTRYSSVYWNLGWSSDGTRMCFKGRLATTGTYEIAVVSAEGSKREFRVLFTSAADIPADYSWHPTEPTILCPLRAGGIARLFSLKIDQIGQPELVVGQPMNHAITGLDWSANGKQILFTSRTMPDRPPMP